MEIKNNKKPGGNNVMKYEVIKKEPCVFVNLTRYKTLADYIAEKAKEGKRVALVNDPLVHEDFTFAVTDYEGGYIKLRDVGICKEQEGPYTIDLTKMTDAEVDAFNEANGINKQSAELIYGKSYFVKEAV
jgi:hypothetical protein|tara:strand:+ start:363 stop:752 length:390 start_codon:yes stop_codon:yes gene_type:complete